MSFFDERPPPEETRPTEPPPPEWAGPPPGVLPGLSPLRVVIFRTELACLVAQNFRAYPTGVEFALHLYLRGGKELRLDEPWGFHPPLPPGEPLRDDFLRLGLLFPDGTKWTNVAARPGWRGDPPAPPVVLSRGGGGGDHRWHFEFWMWPLPPEGPLTVVAEWPVGGVPETSVVVDGGAIRAAAAGAEILWPDAPG